MEGARAWPAAPAAPRASVSQASSSPPPCLAPSKANFEHPPGGPIYSRRNFGKDLGKLSIANLAKEVSPL